LDKRKKDVISLKIQWTLLFALIFALLTAIFAVFNVGPVPVSYIVGQAEIPLVLVILSAALAGGLVVGLFGIIRQYRLQRNIKDLGKKVAELSEQLKTEEAEKAAESAEDLPERREAEKSPLSGAAPMGKAPDGAASDQRLRSGEGGAAVRKEE
jgi:putative membrane protein